MDNHPREILIYINKTGTSPFKEWLLALKDFNAKARIQARINRLRLGNVGDCKTVGEGIFELRVHYGPGYRIYFGQQGQQFVILLCGGEKNTQTTDIQKAKKYWKGYKKEHADRIL